MQAVPFVGPSYTLALLKVDQQRSVNLHLLGLESPGKAPFVMVSVEGLKAEIVLGAEIRGCIEAGSRAFVVAGNTLYEVFADKSFISRGTLTTSAGAVSMAYGLTELVIVDGGGYVLYLSNNSFKRITTEGFFGADTVDFEDNYFTFTQDRKGQKFQISAINDATQEDALDFASAESSPDDLVGHLTVHSGILLFGTLTAELHINTGATDFPFERSRGSGFNVGLMARASLKEVDNGCMWIGRDVTGAGIVYRLVGGQPQRVSTQAVEQSLQASTDLTKARAYAYQRNGLTFYAINAPGLKTTWVYEIAAGAWHERCDIDSSGQFIASRGVCHLFAFGKHLIGGSDGVLYRLDPKVYKNGDDPLVRERTSPHSVKANRNYIEFNAFYADVSTGGADQGDDPQVELSWANYGAKPARFGNPVLRSLGLVGQELARVVWRRLGKSRDRVWKMRFSGNAPFSINQVDIDAIEAKS